MINMAELKTLLSKYGFLLAIAGLVPIRSGILLLQEKDCGCFLIDKATLHANNIFFGLLSIAVGLVLLVPGVLAYREEDTRRAKAWVFVFILAGGIAGYTMGTAAQLQVIADGDHVEANDYDELTKNLTERGWVLYYGNLCTHCHEQFELLGTSVKNLRLIDCSTFSCPEFVGIYPTWARTKHDGSLEIKEGAQSIESLRQMAG